MSKRTDEYVIPGCVRIGRSPQTDRLYTLEARRDEAIRLAAVELARVRRQAPGQYWPVTLPEALFGVLESFDIRAAVGAAIGYLAYHSDQSPAIVAEMLTRETDLFSGRSAIELLKRCEHAKP